MYELYDYERDLWESVNLVNDPGHKEVLASLVKRLHAGWKGALPPRQQGRRGSRDYVAASLRDAE